LAEINFLPGLFIQILSIIREILYLVPGPTAFTLRFKMLARRFYMGSPKPITQSSVLFFSNITDDIKQPAAIIAAAIEPYPVLPFMGKPPAQKRLCSRAKSIEEAAKTRPKTKNNQANSFGFIFMSFGFAIYNSL
jgi:hypothetical protein